VDGPKTAEEAIETSRSGRNSHGLVQTIEDVVHKSANKTQRDVIKMPDGVLGIFRLSEIRLKFSDSP
jgi:hypothetical protein